MGNYGQYTCKECGVTQDKKSNGIALYCDPCKRIVHNRRQSESQKKRIEQRKAGQPVDCKRKSCKNKIEPDSKYQYCEECRKRNREYARKTKEEKRQKEIENQKAQSLVCCGKPMQRVNLSNVYDCVVNDECNPVWSSKKEYSANSIGKY